MQMVTILYPTDFSEVSKKALLECIPKIVSTFGEDSKLILLHVVDITMVNIEAPALMEVDKRDLDRLLILSERWGLM
ncbi:hypothetical protein [Pyrococcus horikoshii]|uniref:hypothetical protein n=1 Tax=Pyrococcus horikoshii TaxID=53953 RepID=UPI00001B56DD